MSAFEHSRCPFCFTGGRNHHCPGRISHHKAKDKITDWEFTPSTSTEMKAQPDQFIFTKLGVRRFYREKAPLSHEMIRRCEYVFESDDNVKLYAGIDGQVFHPAQSIHHTVIAARDLDRTRLPPVEYRQLQRRWFDSIVNGHSSRHDKDMRTCLQALTNELGLLKQLESTGHHVVQHVQRDTVSTAADRPKIVVRVTKAMVDYHDCDNGTVMMFGETSIMHAIAAEITERLDLLHKENSEHGYVEGDGDGERASAMIAVPLTCFMKKSESDVLRAIREELISNHPLVFDMIRSHHDHDKISLNSHLTLNLIKGLRESGPWWSTESSFLPPEDLKFCPWSLSDQHIDPSEISVLLTVSNWPDKCEIGFAGGRRTLGETSLEASIRKMKEETLIDLTDALVRSRDQNSIAQQEMTQNWVLALHLQLNLNCYIYCHRSIFL
jgi:hypothetical protein